MTVLQLWASRRSAIRNSSALVLLNSGYNFNKSTSELGFARNSVGRGFNYGMTASINIFNGMLQNRNEKTAAIEIDNARIEYDKLNQNISAQLTSLYQTFKTNLELVKLEQQNLEVARQNLDITMEKFRLGSVAPLEFREAQRNFVILAGIVPRRSYLACITSTHSNEKRTLDNRFIERNGIQSGM